MQITESTIYWITRLDGIQAAAETVGTIGIILIGAVVPFTSAMVADFACSNIAVAMKRDCKKWLPLWIVFTIIAISSLFIPTTKEMCAIKVIPIIANNDSIKEIPNDIAVLAHEWVEELKPQKKAD